VDVACKDENENKFIVEMQNENYPGLFKRCAFYGTTKFDSLIGQGYYYNYSQLKKVFVLEICNFKIKDKKGKYIEDIIVRDHWENLSVGALEFAYVQLPLLHKIKKSQKNLFHWVDFFANAAKKEQIPKNIPKQIKAAYENIINEEFNEMES
jgi:predicted transposase/invertase (TIGR01784 family)